MQKKNCTVTYSQGQGCKPRKLLGSRRCWQFSFDWRICLALKGHGYYTLSPWPSGLWRSHLRFYREVTEAWSLEEEHAILHHPSQPGSCKMETVEIHVAPQGMSVGLKCLNLEACSSLARGITKTGMHHFPWSLLSSLTLIYGSSFTLQFFSGFHLDSASLSFPDKTSYGPSIVSLCKWSHMTTVWSLFHRYNSLDRHSAWLKQSGFQLSDCFYLFFLHLACHFLIAFSGVLFPGCLLLRDLAGLVNPISVPWVVSGTRAPWTKERSLDTGVSVR